jgi:hypothetical protein
MKIIVEIEVAVDTEDEARQIVSDELGWLQDHRITQSEIISEA